MATSETTRSLVLLAVEFGFRACEQGLNLERTKCVALETIATDLVLVQDAPLRSRHPCDD